MRSRRSLGRRGLVVLTLALLLALPWWAGASADLPPPPPPGRTPQVGDWFSYEYDRGVANGWGNYSGYGDALTSHSRYAVTAVVGATVSVGGNGAWLYRNSSGTNYGGNFQADLTFNDTNRSYLSGIDPDYPRIPYETVWFWVPTTLGVGDLVSVLNVNMTVRTLDGTMWVGWPPVPRQGILVEGTGTFLRHDAYGVFDATFDDRWLYEPSTGFVLAEQYSENDDLAGNGFHWIESVWVTEASYPISVETSLLEATYGEPIAIVVAIPLLAFVVYPRVRSRPRTVGVAPPGSGSLALRRVRRLRDLDGLVGAGPSSFAPFYPVFARRAVWQRFPVIVGTSDGSIHALLAVDRESKIASVFAPDAAVARAMLSMQPPRSYFLDTPGGAAGLPGTTQGRFLLLALSGPTPQAFDPDRILPMRREHLSQVTQIAKDVYWGKTAFWVQAAFEAGDVGFVAVDGGNVVGFAFATLSGTAAQLHTATVTPAYRSRGIGGELVAARLSALAQLGIERVIAEVSDANVPSLRSLRAVGFVDAGVIVLLGTKRRVRGVGL